MPTEKIQASCHQWADILSPKSRRRQLLTHWWHHVSRGLPSALKERHEDLHILMENFVDALSEALWAQPWSTNHAAFRDTAKSASVLSGWCASLGVGPGWMVSLYSPLLHISIDGISAPCPQWPLLVQQVAAISTEAYFAVIRQQTAEERERMLAEHTPILRLADNLPALIVVADPPPNIWEELLDRLLTEAVRTGASAMIVDLSHSHLPRTWILASLSRFAAHKHARHRRILVIGLDQNGPLPQSNLMAIETLAQAVAQRGDGVFP